MKTVQVVYVHYITKHFPKLHAFDWFKSKYIMENMIMNTYIYHLEYIDYDYENHTL